MPTSAKTVPKRHAKGSSSEIAELRRELSKEKLARQAAEREAALLKARVTELEERLEQVLNAHRKMEDFLRTEIRKHEKDKADLREQLESANKQLAWFRKTYFDRTSEKDVPEPEEQQPEVESDEHDETVDRPKRGQKKGSKGHGGGDLSELPSQ